MVTEPRIFGVRYRETSAGGGDAPTARAQLASSPDFVLIARAKLERHLAQDLEVLQPEHCERDGWPSKPLSYGVLRELHPKMLSPEHEGRRDVPIIVHNGSPSPQEVRKRSDAGQLLSTRTNSV